MFKVLRNIYTSHFAKYFTSLYYILLYSLRRADHSSRGVVPTVVRHCVSSRNLKNEEAMTRVGSQRHSKKNCIKLYYIILYSDPALR